MAGTAHVLVIDQLGGDCLERLKQDLIRTSVQIALATQRRSQSLRIGVCSVSHGQRDDKLAQVQVAILSPSLLKSTWI